jgi:hypothetical protein
MPSDHGSDSDSDSDDSDYNPDTDPDAKLAQLEDDVAVQSTGLSEFGLVGRKRKISSLWDDLIASDEKEIQSKMSIAHNNQHVSVNLKKGHPLSSAPSNKKKFDQVLIICIFILF